MEKYFVTAIGTNSGKTLVSTVLVEALQADYWKPIQCGIEDRDSVTVEQLLNNNYSLVHLPRHEFTLPASPHQASLSENTEVMLSDFELPQTQNHLVIEGAGGTLVPLNYKGEFVIDLAAKFNCQVVLVSDFYLGSINHTLLTAKELKSRGLKVKGIVFNGDPNEHSERVILALTGYRKLLHIPRLEKITQFHIKKLAMELMTHWDEFANNANK